MDGDDGDGARRRRGADDIWKSLATVVVRSDTDSVMYRKLNRNRDKAGLYADIGYAQQRWPDDDLCHIWEDVKRASFVPHVQRRLDLPQSHAEAIRAILTTDAEYQKLKSWNRRVAYVSRRIGETPA